MHTWELLILIEELTFYKVMIHETTFEICTETMESPETGIYYIR